MSIWESEKWHTDVDLRKWEMAIDLRIECWYENLKKYIDLRYRCLWCRNRTWIWGLDVDFSLSCIITVKGRFGSTTIFFFQWQKKKQKKKHVLCLQIYQCCVHTPYLIIQYTFKWSIYSKITCFFCLFESTYTSVNKKYK
jgi:hypothetical protein